MMHQLTAPPGETGRFLGFTRPTTTPIPDQVIDELLPQLSGAELKVVLYICRRTLGFQKLSDNISLQQLLFGLVKKNGDQLDYGTGLSKPTLLQTLRDLQAKGIIATTHRSSPERGDEATNYRLCFVAGVVPLICQRRTSEPTPGEAVGWRGPAFAPRGQESLPGGRLKKFTRGEVKKSRPQQTEIQETAFQETDARAITQVSNNTSDGPPVFDGGVQHADSSFWSVPEQPKNTLLQTEFDSDDSFVTDTPTLNSGEPPSPTGDRQQSGVSALIAIGMTAKVAERLAERYNLARIEEKLSYLDFLQAQQPDKVKNPCGWLRTAIEDDFAAPDGYLSPTQQERHLAAMLALADHLLAPPEPQERPLASIETLISQRQAQHGTTDADRRLWNQILRDLETMGRAYLADLLRAACILRVTDDTALIGVQDIVQRNQLQHPQTQRLLSRTLMQLAGRPLTPAFVPLQEEDEPSVASQPRKGRV